MFFIGGFNTVLPYLLYISLIWAFLIIGLSGKLNILKPGKAIRTETNPPDVISINSVYYPILTFNSQDAEKGIAELKTSFADPVTLVYRIVTGVKTLKYPYLYSVSFRGPPIFS